MPPPNTTPKPEYSVCENRDGSLQFVQDAGTPNEHTIGNSRTPGDFFDLVQAGARFFDARGMRVWPMPVLMEEAESEIDAASEILSLRGELALIRTALEKVLSVIANDQGATIPSSLKAVAWDTRRELLASATTDHLTDEKVA